MNISLQQNADWLSRNLDRPVVLTGMMGTGKSQLGRKLAEVLGLVFYDSDACVEERAACSVAEIFERDGEAKFREAEKNTILELLVKGPCVIATGGGAVTNAQTAQAIQAHSYNVWVKSSLEDIWTRVQKNRNRPLLQVENPKQRLTDLLTARLETYQQAPIHIENPENGLPLALENLINGLCDRLKTAKE